MDTLVDDVGSFPLPPEVKRETYNKAYQLARESIVDGRDIRKDAFLQKNFCYVTLNSFRKKSVTSSINQWLKAPSSSMKNKQCCQRYI